MTSPSSQKKYYVALWILSLIGGLAITPYIWYLNVLPPAVTYSELIMVTLMRNTILYAIVCALAFRIIPKTDLNPFSSEKSLWGQIITGIPPGIAVGLALIVLDRTFFATGVIKEIALVPFWARLLACVYGAINEEVLLRFFLFSLLYRVVSAFCSRWRVGRLKMLWVVNIVVALAFGAGHLPTAFAMVDPTAFMVARILILNGAAGLVFGWLYWSCGLWSAVGAHLAADLVIHALQYQ